MLATPAQPAQRVHSPAHTAISACLPVSPGPAAAHTVPSPSPSSWLILALRTVSLSLSPSITFRSPVCQAGLPSAANALWLCSLPLSPTWPDLHSVPRWHLLFSL